MSISQRKLAIDDTVAQAPATGDHARAPAAEAQVLARRYRVTALLGEGGMGRVYHAHDEELDEEVALKMLRPDLIDQPGILERFRREVKLARKVTHPNVARTFDIGEHEGERFLTMEYVEGESPADVIAREGPMPPARVIAIGQALCAGIGAAHAAGVIHRDLKPANAIVGKDERVVVTDFGVARTMADAAATGSHEGLVGTLAYMAPEQLRGGAEIDARADLFALGAVLFEMLTGRRAFIGQTLQEIMRARFDQPPPDAREVQPDTPDILADLVGRCLIVDRELRFPSANDLAIALREALAEVRAIEGLPASQAEPMQRALVAPGARRAALKTWGSAGLQAIEARLPVDARRFFFEESTARAEWMPCRYFIAWMYAVYEGPAAYDLDVTKRYIRDIFDLTYGIVRRFVLHLAQPEDALARLDRLWPQDQTAGQMTVKVRAGSATLRLVGNPYTRTPHTRAGIAENYRYAISLTRAKDVREWHALEDDTLVIHLTWK